MGPTTEGIDGPALVLEAYADREVLEAWVSRFGLDHANAEDVVHEAFARLIREAEAGRLPQRPSAWLHTVCRNLVVSGAREHAVAVRRTPALHAPRDRDPEDEAIRRSSARELRDALASVAPDARRALVLSAEGYSGAEIAAELGRSPEAVRTLVCRTRARLRHHLELEPAALPDRRTA